MWGLERTDTYTDVIVLYTTRDLTRQFIEYLFDQQNRVSSSMCSGVNREIE